ncbi:hypothetical protein R80B4_02316 [Fibrobacteres bacterium R8-0-B4]
MRLVCISQFPPPSRSPGKKEVNSPSVSISIGAVKEKNISMLHHLLPPFIAVNPARCGRREVLRPTSSVVPLRYMLSGSDVLMSLNISISSCGTLSIPFFFIFLRYTMSSSESV